MKIFIPAFVSLYKNYRNVKRDRKRLLLFLYPFDSTPKGIRIPVTSVKGRCPRPLDDGGLFLFTFNNIAVFFENVKRFWKDFFSCRIKGYKQVGRISSSSSNLFWRVMIGKNFCSSLPYPPTSPTPLPPLPPLLAFTSCLLPKKIIRLQFL